MPPASSSVLPSSCIAIVVITSLQSKPLIVFFWPVSFVETSMAIFFCGSDGFSSFFSCIFAICSFAFS